MQSLEADHRHADAMHEEADQLCREWLDGGSLAAADADRLHRLLRDLRETYSRHIAIEDSELFPLAARLLDAAQLAQVGAEMASRRGLSANGSNR
jgi:hemerythrin-like domain-containing protein